MLFVLIRWGNSNEHPAEAILMSTNNICFLWRIIENILSRIITEYPPYLFHSILSLTTAFLSMNMRYCFSFWSWNTIFYQEMFRLAPVFEGPVRVQWLAINDLIY